MDKIDYLMENINQNVNDKGQGLSGVAQLATLGAATGGVLGAGQLYKHFAKKPDVAPKVEDAPKVDSAPKIEAAPKIDAAKSIENSEPELIRYPSPINDKSYGPPAPDLNSLTTTKPQVDEGPVKIPQDVLDRAADGRVQPPPQELKLMNTDYLQGGQAEPGISLKINDLLKQTKETVITPELHNEIMDKISLNLDDDMINSLI